MPYIVAQQELVKGEGAYREFASALSDLEQRAFALAAKSWDGYSPGGIFPGDNQFGVTTLRKNDMAGNTTDSTPSGTYTFVKTITATGWQDLFNYTTRNVQIHAFAGFKFTDDVLRIWQLRMEISDKRFPIIDIQEAQNFGKFSLVFKTDEMRELIAGPSQRVLVRGFAGVTGPQRIVPIGLNIYKDKNSVLTET